jgi:hypothetical protein
MTGSGHQPLPTVQQALEVISKLSLGFTTPVVNTRSISGFEHFSPEKPTSVLVVVSTIVIDAQALVAHPPTS